MYDCRIDKMASALYYVYRWIIPTGTVLYCTVYCTVVSDGWIRWQMDDNACFCVRMDNNLR